MTNVQLTVRGEVPDAAAAYVLGKMQHAAGRTPDRVHVVLTVAANPANEAPATVEAEADVAGSPVHVHAAAASVNEAVDEAADRLRRQLTDLRERARARRRTKTVGTPPEEDQPEERDDD